MRLLQLVGVTNTFQRCAECAHIVQPAIVAQMYDKPRADFHCFRCYHILAAVTVLPLPKKGGA